VFAEHKFFKLLFKNGQWCGISDVTQKTVSMAWGCSPKFSWQRRFVFKL